MAKKVSQIESTLSQIQSGMRDRIEVAIAKYPEGARQLSLEIGMEKSYVSKVLHYNSFSQMQKCLKKIEQLDKNALTN